MVRVGLVLMSLAVLVGGEMAHAQSFGRIAETESNVAYFYHARPGEATVQVSVWGTIPRPGIYEIPDTTDLDKLLTMAGGAPLEARQEGREPPQITVRLYRSQQGERSLQFESPLRQMLEGEPQYPALRDDDIVVVETVRAREPFGWRDALSVASALGSLTLLALRIFTRV